MDDYIYNVLPMDYDKYNLIFKVVLLGNPKVGKTCICKSGIEKNFDEEYKKTTNFELKKFNFQINDIIIRLDIYDSSDYNDNLELIIKECSLGIFIYSIDNKDSFDNIFNFWIKKLNEKNKNGKMIIVGNKNDLDSNRCINQEESKKLSKEHKFDYSIECSAKLNLNTENLFIEAAKILYGYYMDEKNNLNDINNNENNINNINNNKNDNDNNDNFMIINENSDNKNNNNENKENKNIENNINNINNNKNDNNNDDNFMIINENNDNKNNNNKIKESNNNENNINTINTNNNNNNMNNDDFNNNYDNINEILQEEIDYDLLNLITNSSNENIVKSIDTVITINEKIFDIHLNCYYNYITINLKEKDSSSNEIYERKYYKEEFESINKLFKMYNSTLHLFNNLVEFFNNKLFEGKKNQEEIILKMENIIAEFSLKIPLKKNQLDENSQKLLDIIKELKEENNELKKILKTQEENYNQIIKRLENDIQIIKTKISQNNEIFLMNEEEKNLISNWIEENSKKEFKLIFKSSLNDDLIKTFHEKCDNKNNTLIIIKSSKGKKFGGYNPLLWNISDKYNNDSKTFLFSLDLKKKFIIDKENEINFASIGKNDCILFGNGDLCIFDMFTKNDKNFSKPCSFNIIDYQLTGGDEYFKVDELEVYSI